MDFKRSQRRITSRSYSGKFGNPLIWHQRLHNDLVRADFHKRGSRQGHLLQVNSITKDNNSAKEHRSINQLHNLEEIKYWDL